MTLPTGLQHAVLRVKKSCRFTTVTTPTSFPVARAAPPPDQPPVVVMHGSFDAHHLGQIAFDAMRLVPGKNRKPFSGLSAGAPPGWKISCNRARQQIPGFKFEAPVSCLTPRFPPISPVRLWASCLTRNPPARTARLSPKSSNMSPAACLRYATPLKSIQRYFQNDPLVRFSKFDGADFGKEIIHWLDESPASWQVHVAQSAARVRTDLDWQPLCRKAVDFVELISARSAI